MYKEEILHQEYNEALHRLPRDSVDAPFLQMFKARLAGALGNLVHRKVGTRWSLRSLPSHNIQ